jgi:hypothetical protein
MQNFEFYRKKPKLIMEIFWRDIQQMLFLSVHNMKQKRHNFYHLPIIISKSKKKDKKNSYTYVVSKNEELSKIFG